MKTNTLIFLSIGIIVLGGVSFLLLSSDNELEDLTQTTQKQSDDSDKEINTDDVSIPNGPVGVYTDFDESLLANAETGDVILFFSASWCSTCKALKDDLNSNLSNIPSDISILESDYQSDLSKKYKINGRQHTLIQVDENGNELKRWIGSLSLDSLLREVI